MRFTNRRPVSAAGEVHSLNTGRYTGNDFAHFPRVDLARKFAKVEHLIVAVRDRREQRVNSRAITMRRT